MAKLDGIRSFDGVRARASKVAFGNHDLLVANLSDIIKSKRACGRDRDLAVLPILEKTLHEKEQQEEK